MSFAELLDVNLSKITIVIETENLRPSDEVLHHLVKLHDAVLFDYAKITVTDGNGKTVTTWAERPKEDSS